MAVPVNIGSTFEPGVPKQLFPLEPNGLINVRRHYDVSSDGERFLVIVRVINDEPLVLLQNWLK
jgi:hypothetical protein